MLSTNGAIDAAVNLKIGNQCSGDADNAKISIRTARRRRSMVIAGETLHNRRIEELEKVIED